MGDGQSMRYGQKMSWGPRLKASGVVDVQKVFTWNKHLPGSICGCQEKLEHQLVSSIYIPDEDLVATEALIRRT